jgi:putative endonuclease
VKQFTSKTQKVGLLGEDIAEKYLKNKGFTVLERNYTRKWGEIDIVASKKGRLHLFEVKTLLNKGNTIFKPEDNIHEKKLARLYKAAESYLIDRRVNEETEWQIDALAIVLDLDTKKAVVSYFPCI